MLVVVLEYLIFVLCIYQSFAALATARIITRKVVILANNIAQQILILSGINLLSINIGKHFLAFFKI